jgi:hypothetical protein
MAPYDKICKLVNAASPPGQLVYQQPSHQQAAYWLLPQQKHTTKTLLGYRVWALDTDEY